MATQLKCRKEDATARVLDSAYWVKGCSSLGRLRLAVLLGLKEPDFKETTPCLIDIKEVIQATAPRYPQVEMPRNNAERVVAGARALSPYLGQRMTAERILDRAVFMRELLPQNLKLEVDRLTCNEAMKAARFLATVVGKAHARQMDNRGQTTVFSQQLLLSLVKLRHLHSRPA